MFAYWILMYTLLSACILVLFTHRTDLNQGSLRDRGWLAHQQLTTSAHEFDSLLSASYFLPTSPSFDWTFSKHIIRISPPLVGPAIYFQLQVC